MRGSCFKRKGCWEYVGFIFILFGRDGLVVYSGLWMGFFDVFDGIIVGYKLLWEFNLIFMVLRKVRFRD